MGYFDFLMLAEATGILDENGYVQQDAYRLAGERSKSTGRDIGQLSGTELRNIVEHAMSMGMDRTQLTLVLISRQ